VFAKVGDSVTESTHTLQCFARVTPALGEHQQLGPIVERFRTGDGAGGNPFARVSVAAKSGWSAWQALHGRPSPLEREVSELMPSLALVQFGTNDVQLGSLHHFADRMFDIVEYLSDRGVVPVLFTIMPRADDPTAAQRVPWYNAAIRAVAQARQIPLVDYHRELAKLPGYGLASDGIHPSVYRSASGANACAVTPAALRYGFNVRNLLSLQALARTTAILEGAAALDSDLPSALGSGTASDPFVAPPAPFIDARSDGADRAASVERYSGCRGARTAIGNETWYRIEVDRRTTLRVIAFDRGSEEFDIALLGSDGEPSRCLAYGQRSLLATVPAGRYHLVVDSQRVLARAAAGEFAIAVLTE
jgi:lysophospholipase L1-like esterase